MGFLTEEKKRVGALVLAWTIIGLLLLSMLVPYAAVDNIPKGLICDLQGNVILACSSHSPITKTANLVLMKFSPSGKRLWRLVVGELGSCDALRMAVDESGNLYLSVSGVISPPRSKPVFRRSLLLAKYGPEGQGKWRKTLEGGSGDRPLSLYCPRKSGVVLITQGNEADSELVMSRFTGDGQPAAEKRFPILDGDGVPLSIGPVTEDGETLTFVTSRNDFQLLRRIDLDGRFLWERGKLGESYGELIQAEGGVLLLVTTPQAPCLLRHYSSSGGLYWEVPLKGIDREKASLSMDSAGNILAISPGAEGYESGYSSVKLNAQGQEQVISNGSYGPSGLQGLIFAAFAPRGQTILAGSLKGQRPDTLFISMRATDGAPIWDWQNGALVPTHTVVYPAPFLLALAILLFIRSRRPWFKRRDAQT